MFNTHYIVQAYWPPLKQDLSRPARIYGKPQLYYVKTNILVEAVQYQLAHPVVVPRSMDKQQL